MTEELIHKPGWFAVRLRPSYVERRRNLRLVGGLAGTQLQPREIAQVAYQGGFTDAQVLAHAVAVCLAESQGYERAWNDNPDGTRDRGIFQLNTIHDWITDEIAYTPAKAAKAAHKLWEEAGRKFTPWAAFTSGVCFDDSYVFRALLGVVNYQAAIFADDQHFHADRAAHHHLSAPFVSQPQLRTLYPHIAGI